MSEALNWEWSSLAGEEAEAAAAAIDPYEALSRPFSDPEEMPWLTAWTHPGPVAEEFFWSDADIIAIRGPVGSGKTTEHLRSRFRRAMAVPRSTIDGVRRYKVVIARATFRQLWQTTIPSWWKIMPRKVGKWSGGRGEPVTHLIEFEDQDGPIEFIAEFLAFGETNAEIEANIRGVETTDFALEEADTSNVIVFTTATGRIGRYPEPSHFKGGRFDPNPYPQEMWPQGQISCSYNATDIENWAPKVLEGEYDEDDAEDRAMQAVVEKLGVEIKFFRQPGGLESGAENIQNLPGGRKYYERQIVAMRAAGRGDQIERLVHNRNSYIAEGDLVFANHYNRKFHVSDEPLAPWPGVPLRLGLDQGFFGAAVIAQFMGPYQWRILAELCPKKRKFAWEFGEDLRALLGGDERFQGLRIEGGWADMAGDREDATAQENETWISIVSRHADITIVPQLVGTNRITPRLEAMRSALDWRWRGQPGLLIDPGCKFLIRGFEARYVWGEELDKAGNKTTRPKKKGVREADVIDACQYLLLSETLPDGVSPVSDLLPRTSDRIGHNGGPPLDADDWARPRPYDPVDYFEGRT